MSVITSGLIFQEKYKFGEASINNLISHKEVEMEYFDEFDQPTPNVLNVVSNDETYLAPYFFERQTDIFEK